MLNKTQTPERSPSVSAGEPSKDIPVLTPPVDILENEREFLVLADLPGVLPDDVQIRYEDDELRFDAVSKLASSKRAVNLQRVFRLPETVDATGIDASLRGGVLRLTLPKQQRARPREIKVAVG